MLRWRSCLLPSSKCSARLPKTPWTSLRSSCESTWNPNSWSNSFLLCLSSSLGAFRWSVEKPLASEESYYFSWVLSLSSSSKVCIFFALNRVSYCLVSKSEGRRVRLVSRLMKLRMLRCSWYFAAVFSRSFTLRFFYSISLRGTVSPRSLSWPF